MRTTLLRKKLLAWYRREKRQLPWRGTKDPYRIWVSEVMLQQTTVKAVVPYYERFLARFPRVEDLAAASALSGIEFNFARAVGPALAGVIIAIAGVGAVFTVPFTTTGVQPIPISGSIAFLRSSISPNHSLHSGRTGRPKRTLIR